MIELVRTRRSIRKYEKRPVEPRAIDAMKEALLRSPSSLNLKPWTFIFVDGPDTLARLSEMKESGSQFLKDAPLALAVCGDESKSDVWIEDCSIAAITVQLVAHSLGLGTCWVQVRMREHSPQVTAEAYVREVLGIPERLKVLAVIGIGYPERPKQPRPASELDYGVIYRNRYGEAYPSSQDR